MTEERHFRLQSIPDSCIQLYGSTMYIHLSIRAPCGLNSPSTHPLSVLNSVASLFRQHVAVILRLLQSCRRIADDRLAEVSREFLQ